MASLSGVGRDHLRGGYSRPVFTSTAGEYLAR